MGAIVAREDPDHRGELGQPALLAADAEHLDPVGAGCVAAGEHAAHLLGASCHRLGRLEAPVGERDRGPVVLGHVQVERLLGELGHAPQHRHLSAGGRDVADLYERRHPPRHRFGLELGVQQLFAERPCLGEHLEDVRDRGRPARPVGAHEHRRQADPVVERAGELERVRADDRASLLLPAHVERAGESAEQLHPQLGLVVAERGRRLFQQLQGLVFDRPRPPARLLVAGRRPCQQPGVGQLAGDLGHGRQRLEGLGRLACLVPDDPELEQQLGPGTGLLDPQLEGRDEHLGSLFEGDGVGGRAGSEDVVADRPLHTVERSGDGEVVGEVRQHPHRLPPGRLHRLADPQVQLRPAHARHAVIDGPAHELVAEPVSELTAGKLDQHAAAGGLVERSNQVALGELGPSCEDRRVELGAGRGREFEYLGGGRRQTAEPGADDLADALRGPELGDHRAGEAQLARFGRDHVGLHQRPPQLAHQERVAAREVEDRGGDLGLALSGAVIGDAADELAHLQVGESPQPQPHHVVGSAQVRERLREHLRDLRLGVAEGGEQEHPPGPGALGEMPQQQQRGRVSPVAVLDHEHHRTAPADPLEQIGHDRVEAVALGVGVGPHRRREVAEPLGEARQQPDQLAPRGTQRVSQLVLVEHARQALERLRERPVGSMDHRVAGSVQHQRARLGGLGGELADEAALARPRLSAEQHDPATLPLGRRQQQPQLPQLFGPPHERKRRGDTD